MDDRKSVRKPEQEESELTKALRLRDSGAIEMKDAVEMAEAEKLQNQFKLALIGLWETISPYAKKVHAFARLNKKWIACAMVCLVGLLIIYGVVGVVTAPDLWLGEWRTENNQRRIDLRQNGTGTYTTREGSGEYVMQFNWTENRRDGFVAVMTDYRLNGVDLLVTKPIERYAIGSTGRRSLELTDRYANIPLWTDNLNWLRGTDELKEALNEIFEKTGVRTHLYIARLDQFENGHIILANIDVFSRAQYDKLFKDESCAIVVVLEHGDGQYTAHMMVGADAGSVLDSGATEFMVGAIDSFWPTTDDKDEIFTNAFRFATHQIMGTVEYITVLPEEIDREWFRGKISVDKNTGVMYMNGTEQMYFIRTLKK